MNLKRKPSRHGPLRHGQRRRDGKIFWGYSLYGKRRKDGTRNIKVHELWYSPKAFARKERVAKAKRSKWYDNPRSRESRLRNDLKRFGITLEQYIALLKKQDGKCAICKNEETVKFVKRLAIDHCHKTGKVRGLLCHGCNAGLGRFKDDASLLHAAADYIVHHEAQIKERRTP